MGTIFCEVVETLASICAALTREGVGFKAEWSAARAGWVITMTGAF